MRAGGLRMPHLSLKPNNKIPALTDPGGPGG